MGSFSRLLPKRPLRDELRISARASNPDIILFSAQKQAEQTLDVIYRTMVERVDNDRPAGNAIIIADMRSVANALNLAADEWERNQP